jgi:oxygen-independent coproporphyrinogen III oxidase
VTPPSPEACAAAGLYVHVPFCHSNCSYCDFYRVSYRDSQANAFLDALKLELASLPRGWKPVTIYVGGGTPSALREDQLEALIEALEPFRKEGQEYTFEVNPRSSTLSKIEILAAGGVSRVSFGVQTFDSAALERLGRRHRSEEIARVHALLCERIPSVSFDLIFALPGQTLEAWHADLKAAVALSPDHLSVYSLIYEEGTPLTLSVARGEATAVGEETERDMFLLAVGRLESAGYEHYEVSSYARAGHRSRHNQAYWAQEDYHGVGPGASSTLGDLRWKNTGDLEGYIRGLREAGRPPREEERLAPADRVNEHLLLRLRTRDGLSLDGFERRAGMALGDWSRGALDALLRGGFLAREGDRITLTREGLCVADRVISELMGP